MYIIDMQSKYYKWIGAFVVVGILIIIVYLMTRGDGSAVVDDTQTDRTVPEILVTNLSKVIVPNSKTETYKVEGYDSDTELSRNVKIVLNWANSGGFEELKAVRFVRTVNPTGGGAVMKLEDIVFQNPGLGSTAPEAQYFTSGSSASYTFEKVPDDFTAVGKNNIDLYYYYTTGVTAETAITSVTPKLTSTVSTDVNRSDIVLSLTITRSITFNFTPGGMNFSAVPEFNKIGYFLHPANTREYSLQSSIGFQYRYHKLMITPTSTGTGTSVVELKLSDPNTGATIPLYVNNQNLTPYLGAMADISAHTFNFVKNETLSTAMATGGGNPPKGVYRIKRNGVDEFLTMTEKNEPVFRVTTSMDTKTWNDMNMYFYEKSNTEDLPCETKEDFGSCQTNVNAASNDLCGDTRMSRGQRCKTTTVTKDATGDGPCSYTPGVPTQKIETCPVNCQYEATPNIDDSTPLGGCPVCWVTPADQKRPRKYNVLPALNDGTCNPENAPTDELLCGNKECVKCGYIADTDGSNCVINTATGKGQKYTQFTYKNSPPGCLQQDMPSPGYIDDPGCSDAVDCTWNLENDACNGKDAWQNWRWVKNNPNNLVDAKCPTQPTPSSGTIYSDACDKARTWGFLAYGCDQFNTSSTCTANNCDWENNTCTGSLRVNCSDYNRTLNLATNSCN